MDVALRTAIEKLRWGATSEWSTSLKPDEVRALLGQIETLEALRSFAEVIDPNIARSADMFRASNVHQTSFYEGDPGDENDAK